MADKTEEARTVFNELVKFFNEREYKCSIDEEGLSICTTFGTEDIPADIILVVRPEREVVMLLSFLPFTLPPERIEDGCRATCFANIIEKRGCFIINIEDGTIMYRSTNSYAGSLMSAEMLEEMLHLSLRAIDYFNDRFLLLQKGLIEPKEIFEKPEKD